MHARGGRGTHSILTRVPQYRTTYGLADVPLVLERLHPNTTLYPGIPGARTHVTQHQHTLVPWPLHSQAGQSEVVEWVLSTACGVVRGSMRSYIDRRPFLELLALSDAQGCTMLHRCLAAINISPSTSCALRRRLRLACWLLQHGARMECVGGGQVAEGAFLTRVEGGEPARVVERAVRGALRESGGLGQLVLLRQARLPPNRFPCPFLRSTCALPPPSTLYRSVPLIRTMALTLTMITILSRHLTVTLSHVL